jgi:hypothetical protein
MVSTNVITFEKSVTITWAVFHVVAVPFLSGAVEL